MIGNVLIMTILIYMLIIFTTKLIELTEKCIPSKTVAVRPLDLPWINSNIRRLMRKEIDYLGKTRKTKVLKTTKILKEQIMRLQHISADPNNTILICLQINSSVLTLRLRITVKH